MRRFFVLIAVLGPTAIILMVFINGSHQPQVTFKAPPDTIDTAIASVSSSRSSNGFSHNDRQSSKSEASSTVPKSVRINVPFSPQAPFANWDAVHEESCEEMSLIMVAHYWNREPLSREQAEKEVQAVIQWEHSHGMGDDVTMEELARVAREYFHFHASVDTMVTSTHIESLIASGKPLIIPAAGRDLGNPYFSGAGPWYHNLVIVGYDGSNFITNDPGTKRGEGYAYSYETLLSAIHDWTGVKEEIRNGRKAILLIGL